MTRQIQLPLVPSLIHELHAGDELELFGTVLTSRDQACARLFDLIVNGQPLPISLEHQLLYFVGPSPAPPGHVIGSAGPTTSYRMDPYAPKLLARGLKGMIGKGNRGREVLEALQKEKAVYFTAVGGAGALIAQWITSSEVIAYEDLGAEAIRRIEVKDFQAVVANDAHGGDLFKEGIERYRRL